jgi:hypothetical protein
LLACIWGVFILSLFVVSVTNTTDFEGKEVKIHSHVAPDQLNSAEENRLELIRQRNNRKMTLQPLPP